MFSPSLYLAALSQVTLAVYGLSWDCLPPSTPVAEYPSMPQSNTGSPGIILGLPPSQHPCGRVTQYARVTPAVSNTLPQGY